MYPDFVAILQKLVAEQGRETLLDAAKCKAFLPDYTHNDEYKKESRFILLALDADVQRAIDATDNIRICKLHQTMLLHEDYCVDEKAAAGVVDTLALILRGDTGKTETQTAPAKPPVPHSVAPQPALPSAPPQSVAPGVEQERIRALTEGRMVAWLV